MRCLGEVCMPRLSRSPGEPWTSCVHFEGLPATVRIAFPQRSNGSSGGATGAPQGTVSLPLSHRLWVKRLTGCASGHLLLAWPLLRLWVGATDDLHPPIHCRCLRPSPWHHERQKKGETLTHRSDLARALARLRKNSSLLRPATTHLGCQNHQLGSAVGTNQSGHLQGDTVMLGSTESRPTVHMQGTDQRRVHCNLGSSLQKQTIHNHFKSPRIRHTLQSETTPAQHSRRAHAARWWPQESIGRPHRHLRTDKGGACRITRRGGGEFVVSRLVGATVSAAPAPTPAWERTSACTCSGIRSPPGIVPPPWHWLRCLGFQFLEFLELMNF